MAIPPPLPEDLSFLITIRPGILTTSLGTFSFSHVSVTKIISELCLSTIIDNSAVLLIIDLAFSNITFGSAFLIAVNLLFTKGIYIRL